MDGRKRDKIIQGDNPPVQGEVSKVLLTSEFLWCTVNREFKSQQLGYPVANNVLETIRVVFNIGLNIIV